jgi:glycopeptide antibiotics resistance protein
LGIKHLSFTLQVLKIKYQKQFFFIQVVYILTVLTLLTMPSSGASSLPKTILGIKSDLMIHTILFIPFMPIRWILTKKNTYKKNILFGILFCAFCESLHYFIPYREFSFSDMFANFTGLFLGSLIFILKTEF